MCTEYLYYDGTTAMTQSTNTGTTDLSKRKPEEIFTHHAQSLGAEDLDATVMDYSDAAYLVTPEGTGTGTGREEVWLCDGSVMLEGLETLIKSFFEGIL